jgi:DNA-binding winged helix-turn-helix (wHTH) protein
MADGRHPPSVIRFGTFELDLEARELRKRGRKVALQDQPLHVLCMLLEQPGQVVSRDALQKRLWTSDTFVDFDRGLNKAINRIRQTLGDLAASPRFVETLPRRGYRFIASIEYSMADASVARDFSSASHDPRVPQSLVRASLLPPVNTSFLPYHFALSPDGTRLAFVAADWDGTDRLWVRALSASGAQPLNATERARLPFWSPDSAQIGFFCCREAEDLGYRRRRGERSL